MTSEIGAVLEYFGAAPPPRSGWAKMRCPFHEDRHPSASVNHNTGRFHCFVCGIHENAPGLVKLQEGGSYADAKRRAAEIAGTCGDNLSGGDSGSGLLPVRSGDRSGGGSEVASWRSDFT